MLPKDGGVMEEPKPRTEGKYMNEARGMFGVAMTLDKKALRTKPFDYTGQKVCECVFVRTLTDSNFTIYVFRLSELLRISALLKPKFFVLHCLMKLARVVYGSMRVTFMMVELIKPDTGTIGKT